MEENQNFIFTRKKLFTLLAILVVVVSLPLTIFLVRQQQDQRSRAASLDQLEAEGGVTSGLATINNDSAASGGKYILFENSEIVSDLFKRSLTGSWGSADVGGAYTLFSTAADYNVPLGRGTMKIPTAGATRRATLDTINKKDIEITVNVSTDKLATGSTGSTFYLMGRRNSAGEFYGAKFRFNSNQTISIDGIKNVGGTETSIGGNVTASGLTHSAGTYYYAKAQISGSNPTTIKAKIWKDGSVQPAGWQYTSTDSTATTLQSSGALGLQATIGTTSTNAPIVFSFTEYSVIDPSLVSVSPTPIQTGTIDAGLTVAEADFQFPSPVTGQTRNVTSYGGTCNNSANDDTLAIKAAIAAASSGDEVLIPADCTLHLKTHPIDLKTGVSIRGGDKLTSFLSGMFSTVAKPVIYARTQASTSTTPAVSNLTLSNFRYTTTSGTPPDIVIKLGDMTWNTDNSEWKAVSGIRIENLSIEDFKRTAIDAQNTQFVYIANNKLYNATALQGGGEGYGIKLDGDKSKNNWIKGNTAGPRIRHAYLLQFDANHNLIDGNAAAQTTQDAIDLHGEGEYSNEIRNNVIVDCLTKDPDALNPDGNPQERYGSGIAVGEVPTSASAPPGDVGHHDFSGDNNWIHNNTVGRCFGGIRINNASNTYIDENTIQDGNRPTSGGILVGDLDSYIFPELASNPPDYGTKNIVVRKNEVIGNKVGIKLNYARGPVITGNKVNNNEAAALTLTANTLNYLISDNDFRFNGAQINLGGNTSGTFTNNLQ